MESKAPTNHRFLLLLVLIFAYITNTGWGQLGVHNYDDDGLDASDSSYPALDEVRDPTKKEENSVEHAQSCRVPAEPPCRPCPPAFGPETYKDQNDLGPFIHQRLMELSFEVVRTIDMLKLLNEPNSEFNDVHEGAKRLRDASHKLLGKKLEPQYACPVK